MALVTRVQINRLKGFEHITSEYYIDSTGRILSDRDGFLKVLKGDIEDGGTCRYKMKTGDNKVKRVRYSAIMKAMMEKNLK